MEPIEQKSYLNVSVITGSVIGIASSLFLYGLLLMAVNSGSTGWGGFIFGCFVCCGLLVLPGILANRFYIHDIQAPIELGKGALIGLVSGAAFAVIFGFMDVIWKMFGVDTSHLFLDYYITVMESFNMAEMDDAIDQMREAREMSSDGSGIGSIVMNLVIFSVLNVLSGMAASAIFSKPFDKETL